MKHIYIYYNDKNHIGGIMVSVLASGAVDRGFGFAASPLSTQH